MIKDLPTQSNPVVIWENGSPKMQRPPLPQSLTLQSLVNRRRPEEADEAGTRKHVSLCKPALPPILVNAQQTTKHMCSISAPACRVPAAAGSLQVVLRLNFQIQERNVNEGRVAMLEVESCHETIG
jgi:hypothetical protein